MQPQTTKHRSSHSILTQKIRLFAPRHAPSKIDGISAGFLVSKLSLNTLKDCHVCFGCGYPSVLISIYGVAMFDVVACSGFVARGSRLTSPTHITVLTSLC
jgi:hypothetical protein